MHGHAQAHNMPCQVGHSLPAPLTCGRVKYSACSRGVVPDRLEAGLAEKARKRQIHIVSRLHQVVRSLARGLMLPSRDSCECMGICVRDVRKQSCPDCEHCEFWEQPCRFLSELSLSSMAFRWPCTGC